MQALPASARLGRVRVTSLKLQICYITRGTQGLSPDGLSWWLEEVGMVVREDTSLPCQVNRLHWEPRVSA